MERKRKRAKNGEIERCKGVRRKKNKRKGRISEKVGREMREGK